MALIGVEYQYLVDIKINGEDIDILEPDLHLVKIVEESGNFLPSVELVFKTRVIAQYHKMVEGNLLTVGIARDRNKIEYSNFKIVSRKKLNDDYDNIIVRLVGISSMIGYTLDTHISRFINKNSFEVIKATTGKYFTFSTNIQGDPIDKMNWYQANMTDRQMATKAWLHSRFSDQDIMMMGITAKDEVRCRGIKATVAGIGVKKWNFTLGKEVPGFTLILLSGKPMLKVSTGLVDFSAGFPKSRIIHNVHGNYSNYTSPNNRITIAHTEKIETSGSGARLNTVSVQNDTMHDGYFDARDYNVCNLSRMGSLKAKVLFDGIFEDIGLLDLAVIAYDDPIMGYTNYDSSNLWIVGKVARVLSDRRFRTIVTLYRDSMNLVD